ncbi:MAG TPA: 5'/3'-nucleotidase SurE [Bacteroides sp.]|nr:5'/3'-nucleotidase SurE [Bacteroides sp.]
MKEDRLFLVTNDDGINARGLDALIEVVRPFGKVFVIAPEEGQSGMSHAITVKYPIRLSKVHEEKGLVKYSSNGTPVDCVKLALNKLLDRAPDMILSGINHGSNASSSVIYSGTMAAAIEGCINGIPSIGFSLLDYSPDANFSSVLKYAEMILSDALEKGIPDETCLNVNFPVNTYKKIKGIRVCRQNKGVWKEEFDHRRDPQNRDYYWLTGEFINLEPDAPDTDEYALHNNYISIVPVHIDLTSYKAIDKLRNWDIETG